jgi:hypothetical protein
MFKNFLNDSPFLLKISTLFFILWLGMISPKYMSEVKKDKNLTFMEKVKLAFNTTKTPVQKIK